MQYYFGAASQLTRVGVVKDTHWCPEKVQLTQINPASCEPQSRGQQKWWGVQVNKLEGKQHSMVKVCSSTNQLQYKLPELGLRISSPSQLQIQRQSPYSCKLFGSHKGKSFTDAGK